MNIIERLKTNKEAFGLMDKELREVAEKIGNIREFIIFEGINGPGWSQPASEKFCTGAAYRLRADFKCQHPETHNGEECLWCGEEVKPEPKMGWVEYDVVKSSTYPYYVFRTGLNVVSATSLFEAPGMVGFGGVKYVAPCDCPHQKGIYEERWVTLPPSPCEQHGQWKPVAVRFWREVAK